MTAPEAPLTPSLRAYTAGNLLVVRPRQAHSVLSRDIQAIITAWARLRDDAYTVRIWESSRREVVMLVVAAGSRDADQVTDGALDNLKHWLGSRAHLSRARSTLHVQELEVSGGHYHVVLDQLSYFRLVQYPLRRALRKLDDAGLAEIYWEPVGCVAGFRPKPRRQHACLRRIRDALEAGLGQGQLAYGYSPPPVVVALVTKPSPLSR